MWFDFFYLLHSVICCSLLFHVLALSYFIHIRIEGATVLEAAGMLEAAKVPEAASVLDAAGREL